MIVNIWADGSCLGNPGPGGIGTIIKAGTAKKEISIGYKNTTNNRMEIRAVIEGFKFLNKQNTIQITEVNVYSDSAYVINTFEKKWIDSWQRVGWKNGTVKNMDLWKELLKEKGNMKVNWIKVKGHSDNEYNNKCDKLAVGSAKGDNLIDDVGY